MNANDKKRFGEIKARVEMKNHIKLAYDLWAKQYDQDSKWNPAIQMERGRIIPLLNPWKSDTILEIGCGTGRLTIPIAKMCKGVVGVDFSECMLEVAKRKSESYKNIKYMKMDARKRARRTLPLTKWSVLCSPTTSRIFRDFSMKCTGF